MASVHYSFGSASNGKVLASDEIGLLEKYHGICFILLFSSLANTNPLIALSNE